MIFDAFMNQPLCSTLTLEEGRVLFDEMSGGQAKTYQD